MRQLLTWDEVQLIRALLADGTLTQSQIAEKFDVSNNTVSCIKLGKSYNQPTPGYISNATKLTPEQVVRIRRQAASGINNSSLAERYGVSQRSIRNVLAGRTWRNVA